MTGVGACVGVGILSSRGATTPGCATLRVSRCSITRSMSAREASSRSVNCTPIPGATGGLECGSSWRDQRTVPSPFTTVSPVASFSSKATSVPGGFGERVRMKTPPRERLVAKRSTNSSTEP